MKIINILTKHNTEMADQHHLHGGGDHGRHGWMMVAFCIPIIVIISALAATRVLSKSFLLYALACILTMAVMMGVMYHSNDRQ
jgi:hypothetical protein